jgi:DNA-binding Lrp family transcriptional regulator
MAEEPLMAYCLIRVKHGSVDDVLKSLRNIPGVKAYAVGYIYDIMAEIRTSDKIRLKYIILPRIGLLEEVERTSTFYNRDHFRLEEVM